MKEMIFSHMAYKLWHLKFLFRIYFLVSHTYDVINLRFKRGTQKQQDLVYSRLDFLHLILSTGKVSSLNSAFCYFHFFHRKLSEGQEFVLMIFMIKLYGQFPDLLIVFCEKRENNRMRNSMIELSRCSKSGVKNRVLRKLDPAVSEYHFWSKDLWRHMNDSSKKNIRKWNFRCQSL